MHRINLYKMENGKKIVLLDQTTEEKIVSAAEKVFLEKGFSGARTRDIAEEAGINLALLNYYFRSKENLFKIVITKKMQSFFGLVSRIIADDSIADKDKLSKLVNKYTDLLLTEPDLPIFLLNEMKQNPDYLSKTLHLKDMVTGNVLTFIQKLTHSDSQELSIHILLSFLGMTIFPFIARFPFQNLLEISDDDYKKILEERKELIPIWISEIFKIS